MTSFRPSLTGSAGILITHRLTGVFEKRVFQYARQDERERVDKDSGMAGGTGSIAARSTKQPRLCVCGCAASAGTTNWSVRGVVEGSTKLPRFTSARYAICPGQNTVRR